MSDGVVQERCQGMPQGGPLSPLLANVLLDEVDKELERRGYCFARYADGCNVYVYSHRAGERVMAPLLRQTTAQGQRGQERGVGRQGTQVSGIQLLVCKGEVKRKVAAKPLATFKQRVRQLTRRSGGRNMAEVIERLRPYLLGWKAYCGRAQTPGVWRTLDEWLRHRLRAIQLKHWKRGSTLYRELRNR